MIRQLIYEAQDVDSFYGIQVTTPLRTAADLACWQHPEALSALMLILKTPHLGVQPENVVKLLNTRGTFVNKKLGVVNLRKACRTLESLL